MAAAVVLRGMARHLVVLTLAQAMALSLMGAGTVEPPLQSSLGPLPSCSAPYDVYRTTAVLLSVFGPAAVGAVALAWSFDGAAGGVGLGLAAAPGGAAATPARARVLAMAAGALSAAASAIAAAASFYTLEAKAGLFSCLPGPARAAVVTSYVVLGVTLAGFYVFLARVVVSAD